MLMRAPRFVWLGLSFLVVTYAGFCGGGQPVKTVDEIVQTLMNRDPAAKLEGMAILAYSVAPSSSPWIGRRPSARVPNLDTNDGQRFVGLLDTLAQSEGQNEVGLSALATMFHLRTGTDAELRIRGHLETNAVQAKLAIIRLYAANAKAGKGPAPDFVVDAFREVLHGNQEEEIAWQCCYIADLLGVGSPDVLDFLKSAQAHPSAKVRRYANEASRRLSRTGQQSRPGGDFK